MTFNSYGRFIVVLAIFLQIFLSDFGSTGYAESNRNPSKTSAILIYGRSGSDREQMMALYGQLRARSSTVSMVRVDDYKAGQLDGNDYVFIAGVLNERLNEQLGADLKTSESVIAWVGGGIERYKAYGLTEGFAVNGYSDQFSELKYGFETGEGLATESYLIGAMKSVPKLAVPAGAPTEALGELSDGTQSFPYALRTAKRWVISTYGNGKADGIVFSDTIRIIFGGKTSVWPQVYIKMNNVSPFIDLKKLDETAQWLSNQDIPFIAELRPVFANTDFEEMKKYFETVRRIQQLGATIVLGSLQGWKPPDEWDTYIESYSESNVTSPVSAEKLIDLSMQAYLQADIYPLGLSGPPDLLFDPEFKRVLAYFSTFVQSGDWQGYATDIPRKESWTGLYISDRSLTEYNVLTFDSLTDWDGLQSTVERLKQSGATFEDLRKRDAEVVVDNYRIEAKNGEITINGKRFVNEPHSAETTPPRTAAELSAVNIRIKQVLFFVFIVAGFFIAFFAIAFVAGKRIDRNKHLR